MFQSGSTESPSTREGLTIRVRPLQVLRGLGWIIAALAVCSLIGSFSAHVLGHGRLLGFVEEFNLSLENNIPTHFSSFLLLAASALLAVIAYAHTSSSHSRWHWIGLAVIFLVLSIDEMSSLHERMGSMIKPLIDASGWLYYAWVPLGIAFILLFALVYFRFWWHLPSRSRRLFALAGAVYVAGALGLELIAAQYDYLYRTDNFTYEFLFTVEETLEMGGTAIFVYALLLYIGRHISSLSLHVVPK